MCPKVVIFGTDMPSTTVGKIRRTTLAQQLAGELARFWDASFRSGETPEINAPTEARLIERPDGPASS